MRSAVRGPEPRTAAEEALGGAGGRPGDAIPAAAIWCAIPTHQNAATVRDVAARCRAVCAHVVVVDDGTTEADVRTLLDGLDVTLLRHERNLGKGRAILTALDHARARGAAYLVTIDADGQHFPEDVPKLVEEIRAGHPCIVVGCRDLSGPAVPRSSRFGRAFSNLWVRIETGRHLPDTQSGFRAHPVDVLSALRLDGDRYDFEVEVLTRAAWAGVPIRSVDVRVWYPDAPAERRSSFRPFADNLRLSLMHARLVGRQLVPWPHARLVPEAGGTKVVRGPQAWLRAKLLEHATPTGLGLAAALGVFLGTLPLIGLHMLTIAFVTTRLRLNTVMALAVQNLCMPPFVPAACIELGHLMLHGRWITAATWATVVDEAPQRLLEWLVGSLVLAPLLGAITGGVTFALARRAARALGRAT